MTDKQRMRLTEATAELNAAIADIKRTDGSATLIHAYRQGEQVARVVIEVTTTDDSDQTAILPRPNLAVLGIRQCRACGCTDNFGCEQGCHWIEPDLCSACAPQQ